MAPEVWLNQHATAATDLYAVGVMLYEALTGQPPFSAPDVNVLRESHLYWPIPRAKSINVAVPEYLDGIVKRLLAKEPNDRYQTADELLEALGYDPPPSSSDVADLAARVRRHHDAAEAESLELQRARLAEDDNLSRNRYKEQEILDLIDEVVGELNRQLQETQIVILDVDGGRKYRVGSRVLSVHFFTTNEMFVNPIVPGRMETLRERHAVHGGYIEISEENQDREGWNLVLVRPPDSTYGEWRIVETRVSALVPRRAPYQPFATKASLFSDNLACHWMRCMYTFELKDKPLERADVMEILDRFIPQS